ncbi:nuclear transport factor 2 family protein [Pseudonocardia halophobica]|nr:nuclear transport factor 2 family protein [Pseudonocardia halophobica]
MTPSMQVLMREAERVWDDFWSAVYERGDVASAAALLAPEAVLVDMPAMTGGNDRAEIERHLAGTVTPHLPADLARRRISRTVDTRGLVDELRWTFTHDRELPWLLPGIPPTGRPLRVLAVSVVAVRQGRIASVRTLWDDVRLRRQLAAG